MRVIAWVAVRSVTRDVSENAYRVGEGSVKRLVRTFALIVAIVMLVVVATLPPKTFLSDDAVAGNRTMSIAIGEATTRR